MFMKLRSEAFIVPTAGLKRKPEPAQALPLEEPLGEPPPRTRRFLDNPG
jgi:hypothetical protein